jgi:hypothetical protein
MGMRSVSPPPQDGFMPIQVNAPAPIPIIPVMEVNEREGTIREFPAVQLDGPPSLDQAPPGFNGMVGGNDLATATMLPVRVMDSNGMNITGQPGINGSPQLQRSDSDSFMQPFEMINPPTPILLSPGPIQPQPTFGAPTFTDVPMQQQHGSWGNNSGSVSSSARSSIVDATLTSDDLRGRTAMPFDTWGASRVHSNVPTFSNGVSARMTPPPPAEDSIQGVSARSNQNQGGWERESDRGSERSGRGSPFPNSYTLSL